MGANVLIMAGGTGGHVFPALACAREFQNRGYTVHWLGTPRGIENELVPAAGIELHRGSIMDLLTRRGVSGRALEITLIAVRTVLYLGLLFWLLQ